MARVTQKKFLKSQTVTSCCPAQQHTDANTQTSMHARENDHAISNVQQGVIDSLHSGVKHEDKNTPEEK